MQSSDAYRLHLRWILPIGALALILGGWLVFSHPGNESSKPNGHEQLGLGSTDWQAQLLRKAQGTHAQRPWPFAAMRQEPKPMPLRLRQAAGSTLGRGYRRLGLRFDRAQYLKTAIGVGIWAVGGKGITCIFHALGTTSACDTSADVGRNGLSLVIGRKGKRASPRAVPSRFLALGIAPDWARTVRVQIVDGAFETIRVVDNAYALQAAAPINVKRLIR
jgi:hypothetical protein